MDKTDKQAVYDIAAKLGYTGDEGPSVASAIYAVAQARGYEGACEGDASQALQALYTVVSGGGGGVTLGELAEILLLDEEPVVDSALSWSSDVFSNIMVGDSVAAFSYGGFNGIAGGVKAYGSLFAEDETANITVAAWAITSEMSAHDDVCKSRRALAADCGVVYGDPLSKGESETWMYLTIPDLSTLADGEKFAFSIVNSNT